MHLGFALCPRAQLGLMVKLKNSLTQQQQAQLEAVRKQAPEK